MSTTEEQVTEKTPTGADAFKAARASVAQSSKDQGDTEKKVDDTPVETTAEEPEKVADPPKETTEDTDTLTPEELATLPPKERAKAEKWQAKLTQKAQSLSAKEKEFESWKPLISSLQDEKTVDEAIRQLAERRGLKFAKEEAEDNTPETPAGLEFLEPVLKERDKKLKAEVDAKLKSVQEAVDLMTSEAAAAETEATEKAFEAKYSDYRKLEPRMLELAQDFVPAKPMEPFKYLEHLRTLAYAEIAEAEKTKKVVAKINNAAKVSEEKTSGVPNERVSLKKPDNFAQMTEKERFRAAYDAAKRGESWD